MKEKKIVFTENEFLLLAFNIVLIIVLFILASCLFSLEKERDYYKERALVCEVKYENIQNH